MFTKMRKRAKEVMEKLRKETGRKKIKEGMVELGKEEIPELESKKEPAKDIEREKVEKAMERLRTFIPKVPPVPPSAEGKPVFEVYDGRDAYRDIQVVLQYLMNKKEDK